MRNFAVICLLSGLLTGALSCKKINEATQFSLTYSTSLAVPSASIIVSTTQDFVTDEIETGIAEKFKQNGTSTDLVDEINMTEFKLTADTGNLDYLRSIAIYVRGTGLNDVLVAQRSNIPSGVNTLNLEMTGVNIKEHLFKEKIRYRATITFNASSTKSHNLKMDQTYLVKAKLLK
jgi:hypothetical protein